MFNEKNSAGRGPFQGTIQDWKSWYDSCLDHIFRFLSWWTNVFSASYPWIPNHEWLKLEKTTCHMYIHHEDMSHVTWIPNYVKMKNMCIYNEDQKIQKPCSFQVFIGVMFFKRLSTFLVKQFEIIVWSSSLIEFSRCGIYFLLEAKWHSHMITWLGVMGVLC